MVNGRRETDLERLDRNLVELLQEVRVAQTGVQVLFGFLLAVAFTQRFHAISSFQKADYFATLIATGAAAILMIAPTSYHRILYRLGDKEHIVMVANRCTMAGLAAVAFAIVGVVTLITDLLFNPPITAVMAVLTALACATTWFLMPFARRRKVSERRSGKLAAALYEGSRVERPPEPDAGLSDAASESPQTTSTQDV
ncbi:MAG: hypothetical protein JO240_15225 [Solirubrobacterales bacterium]|nr:hypothetical protein [Solirubrobacterales bacterium]